MASAAAEALSSSHPTFSATRLSTISVRARQRVSAAATASPAFLSAASTAAARVPAAAAASIAVTAVAAASAPAPAPAAAPASPIAASRPLATSPTLVLLVLLSPRRGSSGPSSPIPEEAIAGAADFAAAPEIPSSPPALFSSRVGWDRDWASSRSNRARSFWSASTRDDLSARSSASEAARAASELLCL